LWCAGFAEEALVVVLPVLAPVRVVTPMVENTGTQWCRFA
jgi:hypothetical protein